MARRYVVGGRRRAYRPPLKWRLNECVSPRLVCRYGVSERGLGDGLEEGREMRLDILLLAPNSKDIRLQFDPGGMTKELPFSIDEK